MNCLAYALRFWSENPNYKLWYNSNHVINIPIGLDATFTHNSEYPYAIAYSPAEQWGYNYFASAFKGLLDKDEMELLKKYFKKKDPIEIVAEAIMASDGDCLLEPYPFLSAR